MLGFPADFLWGAATSSYQVEGAVHEDGRGESIWDRFSHAPGHIRNDDTGDIACDHYHRYREDVGLVAQLGLNAYRFSIAWPRVIPDGLGAVNEAGLDFYDRLVDTLLEHGLEAHATLYHWDLPQTLEDLGGWPNRQTAGAFVRFAELMTRRLGDRLTTLATLNEPWCASYLGYENGMHAPGRTEPAAAFAAAHHLLLAHGMAVPAIRAAAPAMPVGIVLNFEPHVPATSHPLDLEHASRIHDRYNRWFLDPIVGRGYPETAAALGWAGDEVQPGDMATIAAPIDFLGVNYYTRRLERAPGLPPVPADPDRVVTAVDWEVFPDGLMGVLEFAASRTGQLPLYVMENGASYDADPVDPERDPERVDYLRRHLAAVLAAREHGAPVQGYFTWSLLDNFEWAEGYASRFGLVHVDFDTQERRIRDSGRFIASMARGAALEEVGR
jgi:beta-glucosidase